MNRAHWGFWIFVVTAAVAGAQKPPSDELFRYKDQIERSFQKPLSDEMFRLKDEIGRMKFEYQFDLLAQADKGREAAERARDLVDRSRDRYRNGMDALDERQYEKAVGYFDRYIQQYGDMQDTRADGALYWKAYALQKVGRGPEALAALAEMQKKYPNTRWLNDAKALQLEVNQAVGRGASPENQSDEELKLLALNSLMNSDPERTMPLLEKLLADPKATPRLKSRALFVLAQKRNPRGTEVIAKFAKGGTGNPDLQLKAVEYLGVYGSKENRQVLAEVYGSTSDPAVKRAALRAFALGHDREQLLNAAKGEKNAELRMEAIRQLGISGGQAELAQLYTTETSADVKRNIIHGLFISGAGDKLIELAKSEKEPNVRLDIIHRLGTMGRTKTGDALASMYGSESDKNVKREILRSLFIQGNAPQIVAIARKETDMGLKQEAVQHLSRMRSKEATDFMMELLNK
jgi:tetratricopeptide (TPR) repeat protein